MLDFMECMSVWELSERARVTRPYAHFFQGNCPCCGQGCNLVTTWAVTGIAPSAEQTANGEIMGKTEIWTADHGDTVIGIAADADDNVYTLSIIPLTGRDHYGIDWPMACLNSPLNIIQRQVGDEANDAQWLIALNGVISPWDDTFSVGLQFNTRILADETHGGFGPLDIQPANIAAATVQGELEALPEIGSGSVDVTRNTFDCGLLLDFTEYLGNKFLGDALSGSTVAWVFVAWDGAASTNPPIFSGNQTTTPTLRKYDPTGALLWSASPPVNAVTDSLKPTVLVDSTGAVICSSNAYVFKYSPDGDLLWQYDQSAPLTAPPTMALDSQDNIYIIQSGIPDPVTGVIPVLEKISPSGTHLQWLSSAFVIGTPLQVVVDASDTIYVLTLANAIVDLPALCIYAWEPVAASYNLCVNVPLDVTSLGYYQLVTGGPFIYLCAHTRVITEFQVDDTGTKLSLYTSPATASLPSGFTTSSGAFRLYVARPARDANTERTISDYVAATPTVPIYCLTANSTIIQAALETIVGVGNVSVTALPGSTTQFTINFLNGTDASLLDVNNVDISSVSITDAAFEYRGEYSNVLQFNKADATPWHVNNALFIANTQSYACDSAGNLYAGCAAAVYLPCSVPCVTAYPQSATQLTYLQAGNTDWINPTAAIVEDGQYAIATNPSWPRDFYMLAFPLALSNYNISISPSFLPQLLTVAVIGYSFPTVYPGGGDMYPASIAVSLDTVFGAHNESVTVVNYTGTPGFTTADWPVTAVTFGYTGIANQNLSVNIVASGVSAISLPPVAFYVDTVKLLICGVDSGDGFHPVRTYPPCNVVAWSGGLGEPLMRANHGGQFNSIFAITPSVDGSKIYMGGCRTQKTDYTTHCVTHYSYFPVARADLGSGNVPWVDVENITVTDGLYATCQLSPGEISMYLVALNPLVQIPQDATITGLTVKVVAHASVLNTIQDSGVYAAITNANSVNFPVSNNQSLGITLGTSDVIYTYGSSTDNWGVESNSPILSSSFGVMLQYSNISQDTTAVVSIDSVEITICYAVQPPPRLITFTCGPCVLSQAPKTMTLKLTLPGASLPPLQLTYNPATGSWHGDSGNGGSTYIGYGDSYYMFQGQQVSNIGIRWTADITCMGGGTGIGGTFAIQVIPLNSADVNLPGWQATGGQSFLFADSTPPCIFESGPDIAFSGAFAPATPGAAYIWPAGTWAIQ